MIRVVDLCQCMNADYAGSFIEGHEQIVDEIRGKCADANDPGSFRKAWVTRAFFLTFDAHL